MTLDARGGEPARRAADAVRPDARRVRPQRPADRRAGRGAGRARRSGAGAGAPKLVTQVSPQAVAPGAAITDTVARDGARRADRDDPGRALRAVRRARCDHLRGRAGLDRARRGRGDGEYVTEPVTLTCPATTPTASRSPRATRSRPCETACAEAAETTIVRGAPAITTQVSAQETTPGRADHRHGGRHRPRQARRDGQRRAVGPVPDARGDRLRGHAVLDRHVPGGRRRHLHDRPGHADQAGYYTYRESIAADRGVRRRGHRLRRGAETTIAKAAPKVTTVVSDAVVKPGGQLFDRMTVTGLGQTPATIEVELFGPFASRAEIDCAGTPYWKGTVGVDRGRQVPLAEGDGPPRRLLHLPRADRGLGDGRRHRRPSASSRPRPRSPRRRSSAGAATGWPRCRARRRRRSRPGSARAARHRRAGHARSASTSSPARSGSRRTSSASAGGATAPRRAPAPAPSCSPATSTARTRARVRSTRSRARGAATWCAPGRQQDAALPGHDDAPHGQGGAADEHLHAHRRAGWCS